MARSHARLLTSIWSNKDFTVLRVDEQWLYFTILSQPDLSTCGVLDWSPKRIARLAADATGPKATKALATLEERRYVVMDHDTDELAVRTFLHHDQVNSQPNTLKAAARSWQAIHSPIVRRLVVEQLPAAVRAVWPTQLLGMHPKAISDLIHNGPAEDPALTLPGTDPGTHRGSLYPNPSGNPSPNPSKNPSAKGSLDHSAARSPEPEAAAPTPGPRPDPGPNGGGGGWPPVVVAACRILAERRLATEPNVKAPGRWLDSVTEDRLAAYSDRLTKQHETDPTLTAEDLADLVETTENDDDGWASGWGPR